MEFISDVDLLLDSLYVVENLVIEKRGSYGEFPATCRNPAEYSGKLPESGNDSDEAVNPAEMPRGSLRLLKNVLFPFSRAKES